MEQEQLGGITHYVLRRACFLNAHIEIKINMEV